MAQGTKGEEAVARGGVLSHSGRFSILSLRYIVVLPYVGNKLRYVNLPVMCLFEREFSFLRFRFFAFVYVLARLKG